MSMSHKTALLTLTFICLSSCDEGGSDDALDTSYAGTPYSSSYTTSSSYTANAKATIGEKDGLLNLDGRQLKTSTLLPALTLALNQARMAAGDRDWTSTVQLTRFSGSVIAEDGTSFTDSLGVTLQNDTLSIGEASIYSYKNELKNSPVSYVIRAKDTASTFCVVAQSPLMERNNLLTFTITSLTTKVLSGDCKTPFPDKGGLSTIVQTLAPGDSKTRVESIMGTNGLIITSPTQWTWSGYDRSPGCVDSWSHGNDTQRGTIRHCHDV